MRLSQDQVELVHREMDGANTPEASAAFRSLVENDPEAGALAADLRRLAGLFAQVGERETPSHLKQAILDALPQPARASRWAMLHRAVEGLRLVTERTEAAIMTKKTMLIGSAAVAIVLVIAGILTGFPPGSHEAGTIGGVQPAARYHGRVMTEADVSLKNPDILALLQNDQILHLVQSDAFREAMANDAFRQAMATDAFRQAMASDAFRQAMASDAFRQAMASDAFRQAMASDAFRQAMASDAFRQAMARDRKSVV